MKNELGRFALRLTLFLFPAFFIHAWVFHILGKGFFGELILVNYLFNYVLTLLFFAIIFANLKKRPQYVGYIFLYTSLFKFVIFFLLIAPWLNMTGTLRSAAFFSFFIPYLICLIIELNVLIRSLSDK